MPRRSRAYHAPPALIAALESTPVHRNQSTAGDRRSPSERAWSVVWYHPALYRHVGRAVAVVNRDPTMRALLQVGLARPTSLFFSGAHGLPILSRIVQHWGCPMRAEARHGADNQGRMVGDGGRTSVWPDSNATRSHYTRPRMRSRSGRDGEGAKTLSPVPKREALPNACESLRRCGRKTARHRVCAIRSRRGCGALRRGVARRVSWYCCCMCVCICCGRRHPNII